jgi:hypothetical protein
MADLGGAIITGVDGNPLAVLARQLRLPLHNIREKCPMYLDSGDEAPLDLDEQVGLRVYACVYISVPRVHGQQRGGPSCLI